MCNCVWALVLHVCECVRHRTHTRVCACVCVCGISFNTYVALEVSVIQSIVNT